MGAGGFQEVSGSSEVHPKGFSEPFQRIFTGFQRRYLQECSGAFLGVSEGSRCVTGGLKGFRRYYMRFRRICIGF